MKRTTKGAIAASAAAVLLLGGAGTLAFWTDDATVTGTTINAGHLKLTNAQCGTDWTFEGVAYTTQLLVPGDELEKVCDYTIDAAGDNLVAEFSVNSPTFTASNGLTDELDVTAEYEVNGSPVTPPVAVADDDVVTATIHVDWPFGVEDNDSNQNPGLSATLSAVTVTVTQQP